MSSSLIALVRMRKLFIAVLAGAAGIALAAGPEAPSGPLDVPLADAAMKGTQLPGVMPAGPLFSPLTPENMGHDPVPVPEPVWASVLAAFALSFLRRVRH